MTKPLIINIQKYSIHDGDGIRTTVFFKGCPLSCAWCHNPESQCYEKELLYYQDKCTGCLQCKDICPQGAISCEKTRPILDTGLCNLCQICAEECLAQARSISGKEYELEELLKELEKDRVFFEQSQGGVTLSGGEVLAQDMDYVERLARILYKRGYALFIDTCGYAPYENFRRLIPFTAVFLYDIKIMDSAIHKKYTGKDNQLILENLKRLSADGARIYLRLPLIAGINDDDENLHKLIAFLKENHIVPAKIHLLEYHDMGKAKYQQLLRTYEGKEFLPPSKERLKEMLAIWKQYGYANVKIGG